MSPKGKRTFPSDPTGRNPEGKALCRSGSGSVNPGISRMKGFVWCLLLPLAALLVVLIVLTIAPGGF